MKRGVVFVVLLVLFLQNGSPQDAAPNISRNSLESDYEFYQYDLRALAELSLRLFGSAESDGFFYIDFGFGIGMDIVPYIVSPGIYLDVGMGTDWFNLFMDDDKKAEDIITIIAQEKEKEKKSPSWD
ncbi:MAG: hypothetical protein LBJ31_11810 [Treponema sp.]|jgi:hypothetical protein|nr:hypothetical protein [Treponema sp.]